MSRCRNNGNGGDESESSACVGRVCDDDDKEERERERERERRRRGVTDKRTERAFIVTEEAGTIKTLDFLLLITVLPSSGGFYYNGAPAKINKQEN